MVPYDMGSDDVSSFVLDLTQTVNSFHLILQFDSNLLRYGHSQVSNYNCNRETEHRQRNIHIHAGMMRIM